MCGGIRTSSRIHHSPDNYIPLGWGGIRISGRDHRRTPTSISGVIWREFEPRVSGCASLTPMLAGEFERGVNPEEPVWKYSARWGGNSIRGPGRMGCVTRWVGIRTLNQPSRARKTKHPGISRGVSVSQIRRTCRGLIRIPLQRICEQFRRRSRDATTS